MEIWILLVAGGVILADQAAKARAVRCLSTMANTGSWLGRAPTVPALLGLWGITVACTALVLAAGAGSPSGQIAGAGLVVALGGATSNLLDRIRRGAVIDFIALAWWPAFNLADVAIVVGVVVAVGSVV